MSKTIKNVNDLEATLANPKKRSAYLRGVASRATKMNRLFLRNWKAIGGLVIAGKPVLAADANYTLPELVLSTTIPESHWIGLLKKGVLKSFRASEVHAYIESKRVPARTVTA